VCLQTVQVAQICTEKNIFSFLQSCINKAVFSIHLRINLETVIRKEVNIYNLNYKIQKK
jgi:hypothetical protein